MRVLDASVLLALRFGEPGVVRAREALPGAYLSAANWAEIVGKLIDRDAEIAPIRELIDAAGIQIVPVTQTDAQYAGELRRFPWAKALSLGDRLCLALGHRLEATVLTSDRAWAEVEGVSVELLR